MSQHAPRPAGRTGRVPRRLLRGLAASTIGLLAGALLAEGALSFLLFSELEAVVEASEPLRQPGRWASQRDESLYWELDAYWRGPTRRRLEPNFSDPLLGWVKKEIRPSTYEHRDDVADSKRPVLLYGDSYAHGVTPLGSRYEALFATIEASKDHRFLNYGVGGYGVDQAYLLCKNSIDLYSGRDPLVIFSVLVDDDLDRAILDFRGWPKPRLHLKSELPMVTPPATTSGSEYIAQQSLRDGSWLLRYLKNWGSSRGARHRESESVQREKQELFAAMMRDLKAELDARDTEWFVLLFVGRLPMKSPTPVDWREPFVLKTLEELEIPFVITRPDLAALGNEYGLRPEDLYIRKGRGLNHHNRAGNYAALQTMLRGMRGEFDAYEFQPVEFRQRALERRPKGRTVPIEAAARRAPKSVSEATARERATAGPRSD